MIAAPSIWLPLLVLAYAAGCLYFARRAFVENGNHDQFFSAGHALPNWIAALVVAGAGLSGWFLLAGTAEIAARGFSLPALLQGGVALALPGVVFFARGWLAAQRLGVSSQAELFRRYYGSEGLVVASTAVAVAIAVGFSGLQMRALAGMAETLTAGAVSAPVAAVVLSAILVGTVAIGGLRAVGTIGAVQAVMLAAAVVVLAVAVLLGFGGFGPLNAALDAAAADPARQADLLVDGVIRFTAGLGRDGGAGLEPTAMASFGLFLALMGVQASPVVFKILFSTRSPRAIAAGQTWLTAAVGGGLVVFGVAIIGAGGWLDPADALPALVGRLAAGSPWFGAWVFVALLAGTQLLAGLALLTAAEALVRHLYKPLFQSDLDRRRTVNLTRIVAALLALAGVLMQVLTPVALSALGGVALPLAFQLWIPLLGITWGLGITRQGAAVGVAFGFAAVLLTEPLGIAVLSWLGLELPWGRWPWTLDSAVWGMAANLAATLLVSVATRRRAPTTAAADVRRVLAALPGSRSPGLRSTAWAATLAWVFLAVGPGLVFGNAAFGLPGTAEAAALGMPSIWAWSALFWALGVGLVWFLSYKMRLAICPLAAIEATAQPLRLRKDEKARERERLGRVAVTATVAAALVVVTVFSFGR
jgi:SSS family solute:Na+ symporter